MIYVDRRRVPEPEVLRLDLMKRAREKLFIFYNKPVEERKQKKHPDTFDLGIKMVDTIERNLKKIFNDKCAYCESLIWLPYQKLPGHGVYAWATHGHFRPVHSARGFDKEFASDHYWWLTYEWNNLYYCCRNCNQYKSTWFPVEGDRAPINTPYSLLVKTENALLIDPCAENPEAHFYYSEDGVIHPATDRGKVTIEILKLNRSELVNQRKAAAQEMKREFDALRFLLSDKALNENALKDFANKLNQQLFDPTSTLPFLGMRRDLAASWLAQTGDTQWIMDNIQHQLIVVRGFRAGDVKGFKERNPGDDIFGTDTTNLIEKAAAPTAPLDSIKHTYIERIEIENFKCFSYLSVNFNQTPVTVPDSQSSTSLGEPWLLFLGENGVGKSSLLKAIAIGVMGHEYITALGIKGGDVLKHGSHKGCIKVHLVGAEAPAEVTFSKQHIASNIQLPILNLAAYNSIRLEPSGSKLTPETTPFEGAKARNLFDHTYSLTDAEGWLALLPPDIFNRVAMTLKDLMLLDDKDIIAIEKKKAVVHRGKEKFYVSELSDGYRSVFYLAVDIMNTLAGDNVSFDVAEGLVLIDEIGTHLHPRWRMEVVRRLRRAFPKIRFVVTTHEPLCLRGLQAGETIVLTKDDNKNIIALTDLPNPGELRVDQILTSDFFGLKSTIAPETEKLFEEYYAILALEANDRTEEQKNRLLALSELVPRIKHLGDNLREELVYYVIDELLAQKTKKEGLKIKDDLKDEALKRVRSLWDTIDP